MLLSGHATVKRQPQTKPLIILANGPSLKTTLTEDVAVLANNPTMAVNFFAISEAYTTVRPDYYILADPYFFNADSISKDKRLKELHAALATTDWAMTLLIPASQCKTIPQSISNNPHVSILTFNAVGVEGFQWFENLAYKSGRAMPRPRNVLIPAIMTGINLGFKDIYLCGADHSWMQTIYVDTNNHVVSVQPHFYKDNPEEQARVYAEYQGYKLHDIIMSFYVAFSSYHRIARYATKQGVRIFNATENSYIDAFPRKDLNFNPSQKSN